MGIRIGHLATPAGHHFPKRKSFFFSGAETEYRELQKKWHVDWGDCRREEDPTSPRKMVV